MKPKILHSYLTDDELLRISNRINTVEKTTSGEIAVSIREYKSLFERRKALRELAEKEIVLVLKEAICVIFCFSARNPLIGPSSHPISRYVAYFRQ